MNCVDLFAGAGGFSEGARMAGLNVIWAANHWQSACDVHEANHGLKPLCQDLHQADWTKVPAHDILLASPSCQGHSPARGKERPHHDAARSTAWAVASCAETHRPKAFVLENVPRMTAWVLFPAWVQAMEALGYTLRAEVLDAQFFGVPQQRKRLFIVGQLNKKAFDFHGLGQQEPRPVSEAVDLKKGTWRPWGTEESKERGFKPLAEATQARIRAGLERHGDRPFWIPYFSANCNGFGLDRPIWTLTTHDRYALVYQGQFRLLAVDECLKIMGFRPDYKLTGKINTDKFMLGNAVCPPVPAEILARLAA